MLNYLVGVSVFSQLGKDEKNEETKFGWYSSTVEDDSASERFRGQPGSSATYEA